MAGSHVIPDVYFPDVDEQELHTYDVEGEGGPGGGSAEGKTEDLTKEGFIPIHKLTLDNLPEDIRTEENLQHILDMAKRVVVINNNRLSDKRPVNDQMKKSGKKSLRGSGILTELNGNRVDILTNQHVLFNNEELKQSTFDIFYDYDHGDPEDKEKLFKRCRRGDGDSCSWVNTRYDVTRATFSVKDEMVSRIKKHCPGCDELFHVYRDNQAPLANHGSSTVPTVCLISHPLGRTKHVSFGRLVDINFHTSTLHHTAPSKPGSSGAPVMVFTNEDSGLVIANRNYHVGTNLKTEYKEATWDFMKIPFNEDPIALMESANILAHVENLSLDYLAYRASACLENKSLAVLVPTFGAFLLHAEKYGQEGIDKALLHPCESHVDAESAIPGILKPFIRDFIQKLKQFVPDFDWGPSTCPGEEPDLASLLTPQRPCFCRSIVKLMERGVKSGYSTLTESFLSPETAAVKMCSDGDVTWPWLNRRESDDSSVRAEKEECLMKKCLQNFRRCAGIDAPVILLLLLRTANVWISRKLPHFCNVSMITKSDEDETRTEIIYSRTVEVLTREMTSEKRSGGEEAFPHPAAERESKSPSSSLQENCAGYTIGVLSFVSVVVRSWYARQMITGLHNEDGVLSKQEQGDKSLDTLFSRCLAQLEHNVQHMQQAHPDWKPSEKGDGSGGPCHCGRPIASDVLVSLFLQSDSQTSGDLGERLRDGDVETFDISDSQFFHMLQKEALEKQPNNPGNFILTFLDNCGYFPQGRHSIIRSQASTEAFLYNCCQLLRQVNRAVQNRYFVVPALVFGRPGNWPGNVTPPEVQRKAWRLIQDAIMESGFPPAVLADLEEDAERRQRLIDVYVDMKQLKWQGRIQPHLFKKWLSASKFEQNSTVFSEDPFPDSTSYFAWSVSALVCPKVTFH